MRLCQGLFTTFIYSILKPYVMGQWAPMFGRKPPLILIYYSYTFLCTGRGYTRCGWVAAEYIIIHCSCCAMAYYAAAVW